MTSALFPCIILCLAGGQGNDLQIANIRNTYGHLGAVRPKGDGVLPGEIMHFTFDIKNLKFDEAGKASYSIAFEIRDENGKILHEQKPYNSVAQNFLGGNSLPCSAFVEVPFDAKPGAVDWSLTVKDRATGKSVTVKGKGKIRDADFGIVHVALFADAELRAPMSAVGVVGDTAHLQFAPIGFGKDKDKKQPHIQVSMRILDEQGKPTTASPITGKFNNDVPAGARVVPMQFAITLNRPGRFTIEVTAECRVCGKSASVQYPIRVLPLE